MKGELVKIASGDEWSRYRYRGRILFDTCCGNAGVYDENGGYLARTIEEAVEKIDRNAADAKLGGVVS